MAELFGIMTQGKPLEPIHSLGNLSLLLRTSFTAARQPSTSTWSWAGDYGGTTMEDAMYLGITAAFFALTWWLVRFCDRLRGGTS